MSRQVALVGVSVAVLLWCAALVTAPLAGSSRDYGGDLFAAAMYAIGSLVCHQRPERSFHLAGAQLPVCARCMGLYIGAAVGVTSWAALAGLGPRPSARAARWPTRIRIGLIMAAIPTLVSLATAWLGFWDPGNVVRATLALPLGIAAGGLVSAGAARDLE